jgi:hypothetical protein
MNRRAEEKDDPREVDPLPRVGHRAKKKDATCKLDEIRRV